MQDTFGYHCVNLVLHFFNGIFVFLAIRKVLSWAGVENRAISIVLVVLRRRAFSAASLADRIGQLRRQPLGNTQRVLCFGGAGCFSVSQEQQPSVPRNNSRGPGAVRRGGLVQGAHRGSARVLFILTDYYWNFEFSPAGIWRNWKLYVPIAAAGALGVALVVLRILSAATHSRVRDEGAHLVSVFLH